MGILNFFGIGKGIPTVRVNNRKADRYVRDGLTVKFQALDDIILVRDLSLTGVSIKMRINQIKRRTTMRIALYYKSRLVISNLVVEEVHQKNYPQEDRDNPHVVGYKFINLTTLQTEKLTDLLEMFENDDSNSSTSNPKGSKVTYRPKER